VTERRSNVLYRVVSFERGQVIVQAPFGEAQHLDERSASLQHVRHIIQGDRVQVLLIGKEVLQAPDAMLASPVNVNASGRKPVCNVPANVRLQIVPCTEWLGVVTGTGAAGRADSL
jgi:hypothetical protein